MCYLYSYSYCMRCWPDSQSVEARVQWQGHCSSGSCHGYYSLLLFSVLSVYSLSKYIQITDSITYKNSQSI